MRAIIFWINWCVKSKLKKKKKTYNQITNQIRAVVSWLRYVILRTFVEQFHNNYTILIAHSRERPKDLRTMLFWKSDYENHLKPE